MSLRAKLLFSYLIFVAVIMVLGGWSAWRMREMGGVSRRIIANNYDSVVAAQEMKESLERQDSAALFFLAEQPQRAFDQLRDNRDRFDAALAKATGNITEPGEAETIASLRAERDSYYKRSDSFFGLGFKEQEAERAATASEVKEFYEQHRTEYFHNLEPAFNQLRKH